MDLKAEFTKETGKHFTVADFGGVEHANPEYVRWLEQRLDAGQHETIVIWHSVEDKLPKKDKHVWIANKANKNTARIRWGARDEEFNDFWAYSPNPSPPKDK